MRIAVIGADGQLGSDLVRTLARDEVIPLYYPEFDVTRPERVRSILRGLRPDTVINTAAFHRVDECEDDPEMSFRVNSIAVRDLARLAADLGFVLVHFSTDYVFDGRKKAPYTEADPPNPLNVYAVSKLAGEYFLRALTEKHFLIRSCGLFGEASSREKGYNFVDKMIALAEDGEPLRVVDDQWVSPTSAAELAERTSELLRTDHYGLYHLTSEGQCTWFQFAQEIFSLLGRRPHLEPVDSKTFGAKARRPLYSVLKNKRAKETGLRDFSSWNDALRAYLGKKGLIRR
ncbi:MAG: dTDP-4-dehydrorhamnose reductase [Candidatus Aminicenantes bacterium RBG_19FT_COMBO_58_17]|jgi:dTDP-4-dehydrorhamnose reductase|nr:MAG: dTDP-4-dehydrorhamnose reductase [Candidatus Aminicenantes bacterium RBG_19FT_COMBO_58_17]